MNGNGKPKPKKNLPIVTEAEVVECLRDEDGRVTPQVITCQEEVTIPKRVERTIHAMLDAKPAEKVFQEAEEMDLNQWSKVLARLYQRRDVKVDHNITAMGLLALFPVAVEK